MLSKEITKAVEAWFRKNARDLPWRGNRTPFRVWVSEIMLQQTQVVKVIDYFNRFMDRFRSIDDLARAPEDEVLSYWTGLGYYSRCRNLHLAAKKIVESHNGAFPTDAEDIAALPGVGSYTAGAIRSFAFNHVAAVVDGNIARVLSRLYADSTMPGTPAGKKHYEALSLELAKAASEPGLFHEGIMEIGAVLCKPRAPLCDQCPLAAHCQALKAGTAEDFPVKIAKRARTELHAAFVVVGNDEYVWLERNESSRLLKNLYAPPHIFLKKSEDAPSEIEALARQRNIAAERKSMRKITVVRQLTHRIFHLHGYVMRADPSEIPHATWIKRSELSKVGLSSAVKELLQKSQLLALFLMIMVTGCASQKEFLQAGGQRVLEQALPGPLEGPSEETVRDLGPLRQRLVSLALAAIGKKQIKANGVTFRRDCSGTVRGIFAQAGLTLKNARAKKYQSDAATLFDYSKDAGTLSLEDPEPGDLIFFENTYDFNRNGKFDDGISHVGIVSKVSQEGDVRYVHYSRGRIIESDLRDMIRRPRRRAKAKTGVELFAGYGKFALSDLVDERV